VQAKMHVVKITTYYAKEALHKQISYAKIIATLVRTGHSGSAIASCQRKNKNQRPQGGRATAKQKLPWKLLRRDFLIE
jgi:hypothetical protein